MFGVMADRPASAETAAPSSRHLAGGAAGRSYEYRLHRGAGGPALRGAPRGVSIAAVVAGSFTYASEKGAALLHPGALLLGNHGACYRCGHDHGTGDRCISVQFSPDYFGEIAASAAGSSASAFPPPCCRRGAARFPIRCCSRREAASAIRSTSRNTSCVSSLRRSARCPAWPPSPNAFRRRTHAASAGRCAHREPFRRAARPRPARLCRGDQQVPLPAHLPPRGRPDALSIPAEHAPAPGGAAAALHARRGVGHRLRHRLRRPLHLQQRLPRPLRHKSAGLPPRRRAPLII